MQELQWVEAMWCAKVQATVDLGNFSVAPWWRQTSFAAILAAGTSDDTSMLFDACIAGAAEAPLVAGAFVAGYQGALRALAFANGEKIRAHSWADQLVSFCITEEGGGHPRVINSSLTVDQASGRLLLDGKKKWASLGGLSPICLVAAIDRRTNDGLDGAGRKLFRILQVNANDIGVEFEQMAATPFVPEVPHSQPSFRSVIVEAENVLKGDGYIQYIRPFRSFEDVFVSAAVLAHLIVLTHGHGGSDSVLAPALSTIAGLRSLLKGGALQQPASQVLLEGLLQQAAVATLACVGELEAKAEIGLLQKLQQDLMIMKIASKAREIRFAGAVSSLQSN